MSAAALVHVFRKIAAMPPAKTFPCPICSSGFDSPKNLGIHILKDHSAEEEEEQVEEDTKPDVQQLEKAAATVGHILIWRGFSQGLNVKLTGDSKRSFQVHA